MSSSSSSSALPSSWHCDKSTENTIEDLFDYDKIAVALLAPAGPGSNANDKTSTPGRKRGVVGLQIPR